MDQTNWPSEWQDKWKALGYNEPTEIQIKSYEPLMTGTDVVAQAPTGTGKTLAYALGHLSRVTNEKKCQWLILAPSQELVVQIADVIRPFLINGVTMTTLGGGANIKRQLEKLKKKPQVLVGTPGRVEELIKQKKLKMHEIKYITIDEADVLLTEEHEETTRFICQSANRDRQISLFSATTSERLDNFFDKVESSQQIEVVAGEAKMPTTIDHIYIQVNPRDKVKTLYRLAQVENMRAIVFVNTIGRLNTVYEKLNHDGVKISALHGDLSKLQRQESVRDFKKGETSLLLATDVAARGIDLPNLPAIIQFDMAQSLTQYVHRSGRTGRMGEQGAAISLVTDREARELKQMVKENDVKMIEQIVKFGHLIDPQKTK
ncbi:MULTISPECIES: DEAD/DEAH box helicase [Brochothrix]|uniref:ATP-dependent helicase n=1 Tax=Brochothrix thermosphacta TaxID=2756 RepID=A0A1D2L254_BROTH|nr:MULTISPECIES: DEAD/DEAH box helicase [Brochothrix]SLN00367.1 ATP-dependent RNA helicase YfmL [Brachybacterium faecium]ANZ94556.1 hypothetical protein BFC19_03685 [Brochothrix thermosphacta]ANZ97134.1 hypothetical protein BFC20_05045 [Brochothrix thermosphacta]ATF26576.1 ATP-dependent helicase [Brochothrix thermosphacta]ATH85931.1 ATP-dependent helicase [Brochothrix thermosphacta]